MKKLLQRLAIALGLTFSLAFLFILLFSKEHAAALQAFFVRPFANRVTFLSMLELAAPLLACSLGALVAFRSGHFNLGGEGQLYTGAFFSALAGAALADWLPALAAGALPGSGVAAGPAAQAALATLSGANPGTEALAALSPGLQLAAAVAFPLLCLLAGMAGGLLVALLPALGRRFAGADILLTSFLLSQAAILIVDNLIGGALRDTANNLVAMVPISAAARLPRLARPSVLTIAPFIALAVCAALWLFMERSRSGRMLTLYGKNRSFARLMGYPVRKLAFYPILAAGALHGLAGAFLVQGINGTAIRGMSGGLGWSAIGVALIASNKPAALPLATLLFAWLDAGARQASVWADIPADISLVIKAVVIIGITARPLWQSLRGKRFAGEQL